MKEAISIVDAFMLDRPTMRENNQNSRFVMELLKGEVSEAEEVLDDKDKLAQELPDIFWFLATIAINNGIDLEAVFQAKAIRNEAKYPKELFQGEITYEEAVKRCKTEWNRENDELFF